MKPPTKAAVAEALSILMASVNNENNSQFAFQEIPAASASLSSLPDNVEALTLAKSCINKELDKLIVSMQRRRNLAAPIHKLPIEVLVMIFVHFAAASSLSDDYSLLELATVNKLWYDAIAYSPQLWTSLESWFSPKIAKLVVQRSKNLPLSLIWNNTNYPESQHSELEEVLELVVQNSVRLRSIEMMVPDRSGPRVRKLLESNMPCLERLEVEVAEAVFRTEGMGRLTDGFELLDGPPLKEISLNRTHLSSWSSPRLSGLVALDITSPPRTPSVAELLVILSSCPRIERLEMHKWRPRGPHRWKRLSGSRITLPHLKDIHAEGIDYPYFVALSTSVYTPATRSVFIDTSYYGSDTHPLRDVCTPENDQLAALLGLANSGSQALGTTVPINITVEEFGLEIERDGNHEERTIAIGHSEQHSEEVVDLLGRFFLALPQPPEVELTIDAASIWTHGTLDLLPWSRSLRKLSAHSAVVCRAVLKQLAQQAVDPTMGVTTWVCPNLTSIDLWYLPGADEVAELDGVALETLVRARWSDKGAAEQILEFTVRCREEEYPSIWSRATLLKEAIPCLSLVDE